MHYRCRCAQDRNNNDCCFTRTGNLCILQFLVYPVVEELILCCRQIRCRIRSGGGVAAGWGCHACRVVLRCRTDHARPVDAHIRIRILQCGHLGIDLRIIRCSVCFQILVYGDAYWVRCRVERNSLRNRLAVAVARGGCDGLILACLVRSIINRYGCCVRHRSRSVDGPVHRRTCRGRLGGHRRLVTFRCNRHLDHCGRFHRELIFHWITRTVRCLAFICQCIVIRIRRGLSLQCGESRHCLRSSGCILIPVHLV